MVNINMTTLPSIKSNFKYLKPKVFFQNRRYPFKTGSILSKPEVSFQNRTYPFKTGSILSKLELSFQKPEVSFQNRKYSFKTRSILPKLEIPSQNRKYPSKTGSIPESLKFRAFKYDFESRSKDENVFLNLRIKDMIVQYIISWKGVKLISKI